MIVFNQKLHAKHAMQKTAQIKSRDQLGTELGTSSTHDKQNINYTMTMQ